MSALRLLITLRLNPAKMPLISYRENGFLQETRFLWGFLREGSPSPPRLGGEVITIRCQNRLFRI
jgi:hypothetical protein